MHESRKEITKNEATKREGIKTQAFKRETHSQARRTEPAHLAVASGTSIEFYVCPHIVTTKSRHSPAPMRKENRHLNMKRQQTSVPQKEGSQFMTSPLKESTTSNLP